MNVGINQYECHSEIVNFFLNRKKKFSVTKPDTAQCEAHKKVYRKKKQFPSKNIRKNYVFNSTIT